jgi:hypothetical protein
MARIGGHCSAVRCSSCGSTCLLVVSRLAVRTCVRGQGGRPWDFVAACKLQCGLMQALDALDRTIRQSLYTILLAVGVSSIAALTLCVAARHTDIDDHAARASTKCKRACIRTHCCSHLACSRAFRCARTLRGGKLQQIWHMQIWPMYICTTHVHPAGCSNHETAASTTVLTAAKASARIPPQSVVTRYASWASWHTCIAQCCLAAQRTWCIHKVHTLYHSPMCFSQFQNVDPSVFQPFNDQFYGYESECGLQHGRGA